MHGVQFLRALWTVQERGCLSAAHAEQLKDRAEIIPAIPYPPQGWAIATWEMALLGRGGTLFPVYPEEAPQLEAAKDSSLP